MSMFDEIYNIVPFIIEQRISYKRKSTEQPLSNFSSIILYSLVLSYDDKYIRGILNDNIAKILKDCDIYFDMETYKAIDSMTELLNYATIYSDNLESETYRHICNLLNKIREKINQIDNYNY